MTDFEKEDLCCIAVGALWAFLGIGLPILLTIIGELQ